MLAILQDRDRVLADGYLTYAVSRPSDRGHDPALKAQAEKHFARQCVLYRVWPGAWNLHDLMTEYQKAANQPGWTVDDTEHYLAAGPPSSPDTRKTEQ